MKSARQEQIWEIETSREDAELAQAVVNKGRRLFDYDGIVRRDRADHALTLYHATYNYLFSATSLAPFIDVISPVGYNVIRSGVDTKINHVVRNRVRPYFLTEKGDTKLKEKALGMQRAVEGVFDEAKIYGHVGVQVARHGYLFDGAGIHWSPDYEGHRVDADLVWAWEIQVDPVEAERGDPRQMWRKRRVPRERLLARYPEHEEAIEACNVDGQVRDGSDWQTVADVVEVWDYWHLPSGYVKSPSDTDHDGRHVVCIEGAVLIDESYPFGYFPIALFRPYRTAVGFWSVGIPERLAAAQLEMNKCNNRIDECLNLHARPMIFLDKNAKLKKSEITNIVASVFEVNGNPSQAIYSITPQSVPTELFTRIADIREWSERELGLNEMSIAGVKPPGVDHAPGMRELMDTESIRHTVDFREWEDFHIASARIVVDCLRMLAEHDPSYELAFGDSKQLRRIKWKDVDLEDYQFHLKVWPTNLLSQSPSRRKSEAMDFFNEGLWDANKVMRALDFPDTDEINGDQTALSDNIERMIGECIDGQSVTPEPYMDLPQARATIVSRINRMQADGEPEERIDAMRNLFLLTDKMVKDMEAEALRAQMAAQAAAPPVGGGETGAPPAPMAAA